MFALLSVELMFLSTIRLSVECMAWKIDELNISFVPLERVESATLPSRLVTGIYQHLKEILESITNAEAIPVVLFTCFTSS